MIQFLEKILRIEVELFIKKIDYHHFNERDIEVPLLIRFIRKHADRIGSLLDVGAYYSHAHYAKAVRAALPEARYDGIDLLPDSESAKILDHYYVKNLMECDLPPCDMVSCVSTIEHCGLSTYTREDYRGEQVAVFKKLNQLAKKFLYLSFPYGCDGRIAGQYANITPFILDQFLRFTDGCVTKRFYFNEFSQMKKKWQVLSEKAAGAVPLLPEKGVRCVCVLQIVKRDQRP